MNIVEQVFVWVTVTGIVLNLWRIALRNYSYRANVPKRLLQIKEKIEAGKPPRGLWSSLRVEPMFDAHYRRIPGRLSCTVLPLQVNKENVWQLRVGFRPTAASRPSHFISIPVYSNGQIYDQ